MIRQTAQPVHIIAALATVLALCPAGVAQEAISPPFHVAPGQVLCPSVWRTPWGEFSVDQNGSLVQPTSPSFYDVRGHVSLCWAEVLVEEGSNGFAADVLADDEARKALEDAVSCAFAYARLHGAHLPREPAQSRRVVIHEDTQGASIEGPSSGAAWALAVYSALTGQPVRADVAVTGTVSPDGNLGPVSGLPIKALGVAQAGLSGLVVPSQPTASGIAWPCALVGLRQDTGMAILPVATFDELVAFALLNAPISEQSFPAWRAAAACSSALEDANGGRFTEGADRCRAAALDPDLPQVWRDLCGSESLLLMGIDDALHGRQADAYEKVGDARRLAPDDLLIAWWAEHLGRGEAALDATVSDAPGLGDGLGGLEWPAEIALSQEKYRIAEAVGGQALALEVTVDPSVAAITGALADRLATLFAAAAVIEAGTGTGVHVVSLAIADTPPLTVAEYHGQTTESLMRLRLSVLPPTADPGGWDDVIVADVAEPGASVRLPDGVERPVAYAIRAILAALGAPSTEVGIMSMEVDGPVRLGLASDTVDAVLQGLGGHTVR